MNRKPCVLLLLVVLGGCEQPCPVLTDHPERWQQVTARWQDRQVLMLLRHAAKCDETVPDCVDGDEALTDTGRVQARNIGSGVRRTLGSGYHILNSPMKRTRDTAMLAFEQRNDTPSLSPDCRDQFASFVNEYDPLTNTIMVTHSSCLDALQQPNGHRLLGFNSGGEEDFGVAAFIIRADGQPKVLGCVWPHQWPRLPAR